MQTDGGAFSVGFQGMDATADVCWAVSCRAAAGVFAVERDATSIPVGTLGVAGAADDILTGHNRPLWRSAPPVGQHRRRSPSDRLFRSPPRTPLHLLLSRWCWHRLAPPHSLHRLFWRWCWQMPAPPHSLHRLLWRWCGHRPPLRVAPSAVAPAVAPDPLRRAYFAALPPMCVLPDARLAPASEPSAAISTTIRPVQHLELACAGPLRRSPTVCGKIANSIQSS
jgi:hypothetical protein